ncbi:MAG TPA: hypothetical protein VN880_10210 [Solirubrobacteraceae bacterium]|jgi:hypothetical protein|nr:hypothetical protein [Solirubrobacteraceae bacterium]
MTGGGPDGNERLTVLTGMLLIVLLAVLGATIVWIGQLLWLHLFLGLLLIGPVVLKLLSTGYRFIRYYTASPAYRSKGPPPRVLRVLGPLVVLSTLAVFATGVGLLLLGPSSRQPLLLLHKVSFFAWIAFVAVHVLGHAPEMLRYLRPGATSPDARAPDATASPSGGAGRLASLVLAVLCGLALALALIAQFAAWTG